jgi:hypothetical protein
MNQRIKELEDQASQYASRETTDLDEWEFIFRKKFAELIVQECMTMCGNVSADYFKHRKAADDFQDKNIYAEGEAACDILRYKMKKHFGVEE